MKENYLNNFSFYDTMKKLNNKGYMLVEIIIASVISLVIAYFLIDITVKMVNKNNDYYIESLLLTDKNVITKEIMDDINNPDLVLSSISQTDSGEPVTLKFNDNSLEKNITINGSEFVYGDYKLAFNDELNVGVPEVIYNRTLGVLYINIPAYTNYSSEDYGLKLVIKVEENVTVNIPQKNIVDSTLPDDNYIPDDSVAPNTCEGTLAILNLSLSEGNPDLSKTSCSSGCNENTVGIYTEEDDLGTSCYFRGDVENNYVYFANKYWRIIRINGDGTIRMIYDGTIAHTNGESSEDRSAGKSNFAFEYNAPGYVGYMYSNSNLNSISNSTYSWLKYNIENWYETHIEETGYSKYVADAIYCNDRTTHDKNGNDIDYGAFGRSEEDSPILTCPNPERDAFTNDSANFPITTNGLAEFPVGTITWDEIVFAGATTKMNGNNKSFYLYNGNHFWTMTPESFYESEALMFSFSEYGNLWDEPVVTSDHVMTYRPVISLKSNALKYDVSSSNGSIEHPFVLK